MAKFGRVINILENRLLNPKKVVKENRMSKADILAAAANHEERAKTEKNPQLKAGHLAKAKELRRNAMMMRESVGGDAPRIIRTSNGRYYIRRGEDVYNWETSTWVKEADLHSWSGIAHENRSKLKKIISKLHETSMEADLRDDEPRVVTGRKGLKNEPFKKRFPNAGAFDKWFDKYEDTVDIESIERDSGSSSQSMINESDDDDVVPVIDNILVNMDRLDQQLSKSDFGGDSNEDAILVKRKISEFTELLKRFSENFSRQSLSQDGDDSLDLGM